MINNGKQADNAIKAVHQYNIRFCADAVAKAGGQASLGRQLGINKQSIKATIDKSSFMPLNRLRKKIEAVNE